MCGFNYLTFLRNSSRWMHCWLLQQFGGLVMRKQQKVIGYVKKKKGIWSSIKTICRIQKGYKFKSSCTYLDKLVCRVKTELFCGHLCLFIGTRAKKIPADLKSCLNLNATNH